KHESTQPLAGDELQGLGAGWRVPRENRFDQAAMSLLIFGRRFFDACHRSYCDCMPTHSSGLVPRASDSRNAISAEIPALPLRMRDNATRVTPRCLAASVTETSSKYSRRTSPGCGGLNMRIVNLNGNPDNRPESRRGLRT